MFCPSCGEELAEGSAFCSSCGNAIETSGGAAAGSPAGAGAQGTGGGTASAPAGTDPAPTGGSPQTTGQAGTGTARAEATSGLDENVAGTLSYVLGFLTGLIFFLIEKENRFVRFHAAQSMVVFGSLFVLGAAVSILQTALTFASISYVGWMFAGLLGLFMFLVYAGSFVLWILLMVKAYNGERYSLPIAGRFAEKLV